MTRRPEDRLPDDLPQCAACLVEPERDTVWGQLEMGWSRLSGLSAGGGKDEFWLCPDCRSALRVGYDWSCSHAGEPLLSESVACAWAFQVGQYMHGTSKHPGVGNPLAFCGNLFLPEFTDPESWGMFGWGRWSPVRRDAARVDAGRIMSAAEIHELTTLSPTAVVPSGRPHDPRRLRELIDAGASAEAAEAALDLEAAGRGRIIRVMPGGDVLLERETP